MSLKPFIKTTLISMLIFFTLVFLGMKYHWMGYFQGGNDNNIELAIPDKAESPDIANNGVEEEALDENFHPKIIQTQNTASLLDKMTKDQVEESCYKLYQAEPDKMLLELAVGDCVLSNFTDPYQEVNFKEGSGLLGSDRQKQIREQNAIISCTQKVNQMVYNNGMERQLLLGVCVSNY